MQNESISRLKQELEKFTSFDYPENIRSLANDAVLYFTKNGPLPISDPDSYVVRMISTIFMNPKLAKSSPNLLVSIFNTISNDVFAHKGLERVLNGIISTTSSESSLDLEIVKSILKYAETNISAHFPHFNLIQILMSILLAMISQSDQSISDESFQSFPKILSALVEAVESKDQQYQTTKGQIPIENESTEEQSNNFTPLQKLKESIIEQKLNFNHQFDQFDQNQFNYILYLIFNDFISIALNQKPQWLLIAPDYKKAQYSKAVFDALEIVVRTHHALIESEPSLICIFESAVIQSMWDTNALEFIICFIDIYLESHPSLCIGLFEEFLSRIPTHKIAVEQPPPIQVNEASQNSSSRSKIPNKKSPKSRNSKTETFPDTPPTISSEINKNKYDFPLPQISNQALASFYFFRSIATNDSHFASRLYTTCDNNDHKLFERLFNSLQLYIERQLFYETGAPARKRHHLAFKLYPTRWKLIQTEKAQQKFIQKSPFEIAFGVLNSFVSTSENQNYNEEEDSNEIRSFGTDYEEQYGNFIRKERNLTNISKLALSAMRCSTLETFKLPCNFLTNVLRILRFTKSETNQNEFKDSFYQAFGSICDFANKLDKELIPDLQVELQISDKVGLFYLSLRNLAEKHPELCSGNWVTILNSLFKEKVSFELDFASHFSEYELGSIVESAISIKPLPYIFITNLINANQSEKRFKLIWGILGPFFNKALDEIDVMITGKIVQPVTDDSTGSNKSSGASEPIEGEKQESDPRIIQSRNFDEEILELLLDVFNRAIFDISEIDIVSMIYKYISDQKLALIYKERILAQLRTVLTEKGLVIVKSWDILFHILSPDNFKNRINTIEADKVETSVSSPDNNTELLHFAFNVLTLLSNDLIHRVPQDTLFNLINLIISYGNCTVDINVSLSSFDLLWNVVRVMTSNVENWKYLMKQVLALVPDQRNDVSQCAIKTFFSLMCTNFEQIPNDVIEYFVGTGFTEILNALDISNQQIAPSFELALQEFAHYSSTFWTSFDKIEAFHKKFLPQLIEKAKTFCITCRSNEIVANSFHFFETMFECPYLDPVSAELLRKGIEEMADNYINVRQKNNMIFSCFGRLLNCVIFSLKKRNTLETLPLWFPMTKKLVTGLTADGYIHITPQRLLDVLPSLFPMCDVDITANLNEASENDNDDYSSEHKLIFTYSDSTYHSKVAIQLIQLLVEFLSSTDKYMNNPMQEFMFDILCQIYQTQMPDSVRLTFVMSCKQLGSNNYSKQLSTLFIDTKIREIIDINSAPDVFECFLTICSKWPELQDKARRSLVDVLDKADNELQLSFIHANREIIPIILLIWTTYFDPNSERFNQKVLDNCFTEILDVISVLLGDSNVSVDDLLQILKYLEKSLTPENAIGNSRQTQQSHLLRLMTPLTKLIASPNEEIRKTVQDIFEIITNIVSSML